MPHNFLENKFQEGKYPLRVLCSTDLFNLECLSNQANKARSLSTPNIFVTSYLAHDARVDRLDGDVLRVEVQAVHQALGGPNELIALSAVRA